MVKDTRTMFGDMVVINAVPAFMMTNGTFAAVTSGAIDMALGEKITPPRISTFSRAISSCAAALAIGPPGRLESRTINLIVSPPSSLACSFI